MNDYIYSVLEIATDSSSSDFVFHLWTECYDRRRALREEKAKQKQSLRDLEGKKVTGIVEKIAATVVREDWALELCRLDAGGAYPPNNTLSALFASLEDLAKMAEGSGDTGGAEDRIEKALANLPLGPAKDLCVSQCRVRVQSVRLSLRLKRLWAGRWDPAEALAIVAIADSNKALLLHGSERLQLRDVAACLQVHDLVVATASGADHKDATDPNPLEGRRRMEEVLRHARQIVDPVRPEWTNDVVRPLRKRDMPMPYSMVPDEEKRSKVLLEMQGALGELSGPRCRDGAVDPSPSSMGPPEEPPKGLRALLRDLQHVATQPATADQTFAVVSAVNVWLRVQGLQRSFGVVRDAGGKVVPEVAPTAGTQHDIFVPHTTNALWTKESSLLYEQCCLQYQIRQQFERVQRELHSALRLADEDFIKSAVNCDLYGKLLEQCDEVCIAQGERVLLEDRLDTLLRSRIKVYHPSGEIRVVTIPQRQTFANVMQQLNRLFPGGSTPPLERFHCKYVDGDGDKVRIQNETDWVECLRQKRDTALLSYTLKSTGSTPSSAGEAIISLFFEMPGPPAASPVQRPPVSEAPRVPLVPPPMFSESPLARGENPPRHNSVPVSSTEREEPPRGGGRVLSQWGAPVRSMELAKHSEDLTSSSRAVASREKSAQQQYEQYLEERERREMVCPPYDKEALRKMLTDAEEEEDEKNRDISSSRDETPRRGRMALRRTKSGGDIPPNQGKGQPKPTQPTRWNAPYRRSGVEIPPHRVQGGRGGGGEDSKGSKGGSVSSSGQVIDGGSGGGGICLNGRSVTTSKQKGMDPKK